METDHSNKLGTAPIGRLLITMAIPMMISFFIQALYNIVDSIFVARISEDELKAVSLAFPMQNIMIAISVGIGVGINAMVPRALALKNIKKADKTANSGFFICLVFSVLFMLMGFTLSGPFMKGQTDVQAIVDYGTIYLRICWGIPFGVFFSQLFEKMLIANGHATFAMVTQAVGAVINIIFDPLLIFGFGPFPKMGIAGAAAATVFGQLMSMVVGYILNRRKISIIGYSLTKIFHPSLAAIKDIFSVGIPSMIVIGLSSINSFCINKILIKYSTTAIAVYGIWLKLQNFCYMPSFGFNNAMVPILSYNYARKNYDRIKETLRIAFTVICVLMFVLTIIFMFMPQQLLYMFDASENMIEIGSIALRFGVASLVFGGASVICGSSTQAMGRSRYSLIQNIFRQFILPFGSFWILSLVFDELNYLWAALLITEVISVLIAIVYEIKMLKDIRKEFE